MRSNVYLSGKPERQKHYVPLDTARYAGEQRHESWNEYENVREVSK